MGAAIVAIGFAGTDRWGAAERRAYGREVQRAVMPTEDLARRVVAGDADLVLDHDRKIAVSEALGLSFARVRALRRLTDEPLTLRALWPIAWRHPPYVTFIVDDLEERGLVRRRPHPRDRARSSWS